MINDIGKINIISQIIQLSKESYLSNNSELNISKTSNKIEEFIISQGIEYEEFKDDIFSIDLTVFGNNIKFFIDLGDFESRFLLEDFIESPSDIIIFNFTSKLFYFNFTSEEILINNEICNKNYLIKNLHSYHIFLKLLKSTDFCDYFNSLSSELVIYNSTKGILKIKTPYNIPKFNFNFDYSTLISEAIQKLKIPEFVLHFKNQLFEYSSYPIDIQLQRIIENLKNVLQDADNNYQLHIRNFSFEKFKDDLIKEKEKYFISLREILSKILSQLIGVPLSISASTFASYKIENPFIIFLIMISFFIYVVFSIYFQCIYFKDVTEIKDDFKRDFKSILRKSGLNTKSIKVEKNKIKRRIVLIKSIILSFISSILILSILLFYYLGNQLIDLKNNKKNDSQFEKLKKELVLISKKRIF